ncbi:hypothetical protein JAAARDRAFT_187158 [Jaapia argillacea MUCL 33604]|uniref:Endosomal/vacuolar adapter protein YPT35 n=1 Tax=Jaapia argillacea MUCL 33604 TaxID=933084 RepID=A0A067PFC9_9AGAM|nr:hypothetical protein JAAARDRAFT_187158 [Jaapia argillacea MUCL 33604]
MSLSPSPQSGPSSHSVPRPATPTHPFRGSHNLLEVIPNGIDVEEESRLYEELCESPETHTPTSNTPTKSGPRRHAPSVLSNDIWLGDNSGSSSTFARDVKISGWTNVGDKLGGAYVVFDCVIRTKEETSIHVHKRYSDFERLYSDLVHTLPRNRRHLIPALPPKSALAKYRPAFLDKRRRQLELWLASVVLHPDVGGCTAVGRWVME